MVAPASFWTTIDWGARTAIPLAAVAEATRVAAEAKPVEGARLAAEATLAVATLVAGEPKHAEAVPVAVEAEPGAGAERKPARWSLGSPSSRS